MLQPSTRAHTFTHVLTHTHTPGHTSAQITTHTPQNMRGSCYTAAQESLKLLSSSDADKAETSSLIGSVSSFLDFGAQMTCTLTFHAWGKLWLPRMGEPQFPSSSALARGVDQALVQQGAICSCKSRRKLTAAIRN